MNTVAISAARSNLPKLIDRISKTLDKITITVNGQAKVALISIEELESLEETSEILSLQNAKASILKGLAQAKKKQGKKIF